jgi:hypothetical protein
VADDSLEEMFANSNDLDAAGAERKQTIGHFISGLDFVATAGTGEISTLAQAASSVIKSQEEVIDKLIEKLNELRGV